VTTAEYEAELEKAKDELELQVKKQDEQLKTLSKQVLKL
jgi:hypothetical protein